ncbi:MAG TPA: hypothetical protein DEP27_06225 [Ruminococcaceae bacterium]|jgi:hypothetical protein|nr:hypothetical protein [Oscillospiraceae bacterium]
MTPRDISECVSARQDAEEERYKMKARLFDFVGIKIIAGRRLKNPKDITLHDYFPQLFKADGSSAAPTNMSPAAKQKIAVKRWKEFLGV